jgi:hypothetical protein
MRKEKSVANVYATAQIVKDILSSSGSLDPVTLTS